MKKITIFDWLIIIILLAGIGISVLALTYKKEVSGQKMIVTIEVNDYTKSTFNEAKNTKEVFLNSTNLPVKTQSVNEKDGKLLINLEGLGEKENGSFIFNGQRILVNQKAEIHTTYFVQGKISEIKYAQ